LKEQPITLGLDPNTKIVDVKQLFGVTNKRLKFKKRNLKNEETLIEAGVGDGDTIGVFLV
jgi:hypothetical protein